MKPHLALLACVALSGCASFNAEPNVYVVSNNQGGYLADEARWEHDRGNRTVMIDGQCNSRCVAWAYDLARREPDKICITRNALFGLHQGYRKVGDSIVWGYPIYAAPLNDWAEARGGLPASMTMLDMGYRDALKFWRPCTSADWKVWP